MILCNNRKHRDVRDMNRCAIFFWKKQFYFITRR